MGPIKLLPEALSELDIADKRRGEGAASSSTTHPPSAIWLRSPTGTPARTEQVGLMADAGRNFEQYVALRGTA